MGDTLAQLRRRLSVGLPAAPVRVHPHVVDPAAVPALAEPGSAVPLRRLRPVPAHLPSLPAAARAARPLADGRDLRPPDRPERARVTPRAALGRKSDGTHTRRDPPHPARPRPPRLQAARRRHAARPRSRRASRTSGATGPTSPTRSSSSSSTSSGTGSSKGCCGRRSSPPRALPSNCASRPARRPRRSSARPTRRRGRSPGGPPPRRSGSRPSCAGSSRCSARRSTASTRPPSTSASPSASKPARSAA